MVAGVDLSVLVSAALAVTWIFGQSRENTQDKEGASAIPKTPADIAIRCALWVHGVNQLLPAVLLAASAVSPLLLLRAAVTIDFGGLFGEETSSAKLEAPDWLGHDAGFLKHLFLAASLAVWRAEKLESLLQRMQRSVNEVKRTGAASIMSGFVKDPIGYGWPVFWGITRRVALVVVGSCGCIPFLQTAFPAVVLDECLWWVVANAQNLWDRKVCSIPAAVNILVMPLVDLLHFIPVLMKVFFLGLTAYPYYDGASVAPGLLVACAFAWTAHNCHMLYTTLFLDLPDSARALWAARQGGGGG